MGCKYENCTENVSPHFPDYCIYHAPFNKRDIISETEFNNLITQKLNSNQFNFEGYIFPYFFDFSVRNNYSYILNLKNAEFHGNKLRSYSLFGPQQQNDVCVYFNNNIFEHGLDFSGCKFMYTFVFTNSTVNHGSALFKGAIFYNSATFEHSKFNNCSIDFSESIFKEIVSFNHIIVKNNTTPLHSNILNFSNTVFLKNAHFNLANIKIKYFQFNNASFNGKFVTFDDIITDCYKINFYKTIINCDTFQFKNANVKTLLFYLVEAVFNCNVTFNGSKFQNSMLNENPYLLINNCDFLGNDSSFDNSIFELGIVNFNNSIFYSDLSFVNTVFQNGVSFDMVNFRCKLGINEITVVNFTNTKVNNAHLSFSKTEFLCDKVLLHNNYIKGDIYLLENKFKKELLFKISDLILDVNSKFKFSDPINHDTDFNFTFIFENIIFNPLKTIFSNIYKNRFLSRDISKDESIEFALIFRACLLNGVNFINNEMSNFSFYKSTFEEAVFDNLVLNYKKEKLKYIPYRRNNILFEDYFNTVVSKMDISLGKIEKEKYKLEDSFSFYQVSNMYRTMKKVSDNNKDYQRAGDFYFNEFEMERLSNKKVNNPRYIINSSYKWLAGYGEKPLWCFIWIIIFTTLFSTTHLFLGFSIKEDSFKYIVLNENSSFNLGTYLFDVLMAVVYTLSRVIPLSYFQLEVKSVTSLNVIGLALSLLNSVVLFVMFAFLFVSLKRQFRRY